MEIKQPVKMAEQSPKERVKNFKEVALGLTEAQAKEEASRCMHCAARPCVKNCPVGIDIPTFLQQVSAGKFEDALNTISLSSILPSICGRVCPQERQCQGSCTVGKVLKSVDGSVQIGKVERFVGDWARENKVQAKGELSTKLKGKNIAVIGTGPAGLAAAVDLKKAGANVDVYESLHKEGGVLTYGIPEFRLPKSIVASEVNKLKDLGISVRCNFLAGKTESVEEWLKAGKYDAAFIGLGAGLPMFMNIPGENLVGVFSANEYLTRVNLMKSWDKTSHTPVWKGQEVVVFGAGNVAMDASRTALRMGAKSVTIVYRRTKAEAPARVEELHHAEEEGVKFAFLCNPKEIIATETGSVKAVRAQKCELGEPDASGRRKPVEIPGEFIDFPADTVIVAIGNRSNPIARDAFSFLKFTEKGTIWVNEGTLRTSCDKVWAGGDIVTGAATVISAMGQGRQAASEMIECLSKQ